MQKEKDNILNDNTKQTRATSAPAPQPVLKCVRNTHGEHRLYRQMPDGKLKYVPHIGRSTHPFEVVAQFPNQPIVAVKRYVKTGHTITPRLYLVDLTTGKIPAMSAGGVPFIYYNQSQNKFVADPTSAAMADAHDLSADDTAPTMTAEIYLQYLQQLQMILASQLGQKLDIVARPARRKRKSATQTHFKKVVPYNIHKKPTLRYRVAPPRIPMPQNKMTMHLQQHSQHTR